MDAGVTVENFLQKQIDFWKAHRELSLMIRPDRHFDHAAHRYPDDAARRKGDEAMKAWFEYLAAKRFFVVFNSWRWVLKSGRSIMVVCADPLVFDAMFVPPLAHSLFADFWDDWERSRVPVDHRYDDPDARDRALRIIRSCAGDLRMNARPCRDREPEVQPLREWSAPLAANAEAPSISEELREQLSK
jgi:hypothetical protein